ncbi:hypothetical protein OROMI_007060 [Orobanche minor]
MASSPNVRPYPNSATGVDAESTTAAAAVAASVAAAAAASAAAAATTTLAENQVVWKRPNMRGSKCSINGYVRLGIVKTITAELRSVGDDTFREFRESCLGHFIQEEWAALHALFLSEVVRLDTQVDEFWFRTGHRLIRFSRYEEQSGDALKVAKILIWACEAIPSLGSKCGIMLGASFIQRPRCTRWKLKKLGHIDFTTFFDDESLGINELIRNSPIEPQFERALIPPDRTMSVPDAGRSSLPTETRVDGSLSPTEQTEEVLSPGRAPVLVEHTSSLDHHADGGSVLTECTQSLDHQSSIPIVTPPVIPTEILVTPPEIAPRTWPSSSTVDLSPIPLEYSSTTIPADTYHSPKLQCRSYRPHSPFSTTVVRKRKDLDEEAYRRWLDSGESVNVGAACGASASWFLMLQDASTLIDAEHLDAYMVILQFDPGFVGVRWLDDWAAQTVLVHTSFLATCINVWNNSQRKGDPLSIDDEDLDFLVSHIHGLRPFWGDYRPWWELREVLTIWNTSPESSCGHWLVLRIRLEEGIIIMHDSLAHEEDAYLKLRSQQSLAIIFLIPTILQRSGFYERRLDITPVPQFRVAIAKKDLCYVQDDSTSCGALSIHTLESLVQHSFSHGKTETDIYAFRGRMARAIWRFSDDADIVVCDPTSLFIRFDDRD